jgi:hypothetical protein
VHRGPITDYTPQSAVEIITTGKFVRNGSDSMSSHSGTIQETTNG